MSLRPEIPIALTVAGSDSGGGAGIQADLKTFAALGVHGTSAVTCITAQNPRKVLAIEPCSASLLRGQLEALFAELRPSAMKTGMLYTAAIVEVVVGALKHQRVPLIVDPVLVSTSGTRLLQTSALELFRAKLLPMATLVTPNVQEAEILTQTHVNSPEDLRAAARQLYVEFRCAVLVKGGHLRGLKKNAIDIFFDGRQELLLSAPFIPGIKTHGTGCTYSAAITACLARGLSLARSVETAKEFITQAIAQSRVAAGHVVLNSFWHGSPAEDARQSMADRGRRALDCKC
jgi:hydroxymethylpyrimidine/phosphomethylpyrimidine kinase